MRSAAVCAAQLGVGDEIMLEVGRQGQQPVCKPARVTQVERTLHTVHVRTVCSDGADALRLGPDECVQVVER